MRKKMKIVIIGLLLLNTSLLFGQIDPVSGSGIAIGGYDVVSYFTTGNPVKGQNKFKTKFGSGTYLFSTADNKKMFDENPSIYLPQFDGYCALAVSYGKKISIDPETFKIVNDKLYLFYHSKSIIREVNSLETWNKNEPKLLKKADQLWPDVKQKHYEPSQIFR